MGKLILPTAIKVSIHTPPWGRDFLRFVQCRIRPVSIHTPPWGRDGNGKLLFQDKQFQFTRPRGGAITRQPCSKIR